MNISFLSRIVTPTVLLYLFVVVMEFSQGFYSAAAIDPPPVFTFGVTFAFLWIIGWWLLRDSRKRGVTLPYDIGMFLFVMWPIIMPFYLIKSRGVRGLLVMLGFVGAWAGAFLSGIILFVIFTTLGG